MSSVDSIVPVKAPANPTTQARHQSPEGSRKREERRATREADELWAVVLAGGDGNRVSALTGTSRASPCRNSIAHSGAKSLSCAGLCAVPPRSSPGRGSSVVVTEHHRRHWRQTLADLPPENVIVQPRNRGTAAGILLPVLDIVLSRDRAARVLVLPADHHVASEDVLRRTLLVAGRAVRRPNAPVVMLGMAAQRRR